MRRILAALVALMLALTAVGALAEAAVDASTETTDFGDFSMTYPADVTLEMAAKEENGVYFTLSSPAGEDGFTGNLSCVWSSEYEDFSGIEPQDLLDYVLETFAGEAEGEGLIVTNVEGLNADWLQLGGKKAVAVGYSYDVDYSQLGLDYQTNLMCLSATVSDPAFGTYNFSITTDTAEGLNALAAVMDTITWN